VHTFGPSCIVVGSTISTPTNTDKDDRETSRGASIISKESLNSHTLRIICHNPDFDDLQIRGQAQPPLRVRVSATRLASTWLSSFAPFTRLHCPCFDVQPPRHKALLYNSRQILIHLQYNQTSFEASQYEATTSQRFNFPKTRNNNMGLMWHKGFGGRHAGTFLAQS
jgi:hypothetical protein